MSNLSTILSCLRETVRRFPERPAVSDAARTLTYRELDDAVTRAATELGREGVTQGRPQLVEARPTVDFVVAALATVRAGGVFVPYASHAPAARVAQLKAALRDFCDSHIAEVLYTTGTTGASKGVLVTAHAAWASADNNRFFDQITEETVYLIASPLNHVSALRKVAACFLVGAHAVLQDGFVDVKRYYETIARHRVNALLLPPAAATLLLAVSRKQLSALADPIRVVHSNGAPLLEGTREALRQCLPHTRLVFAYGATEAGSACCAYDYAAEPGKVNGVGRTGPHTQIAVEEGRLVVSGETVMAGYLNDPVRTAEVLCNGKVYTQDLGRIDADGFVTVSGRAGEIINCGGLKVAPVEVEEVAMRAPDIVDCACFGVPDRFTGQAVKLLVVPKDLAHFNLTGFRHFLQERLERYQVPSQIECVPSIPRTANGKKLAPVRRPVRGGSEWITFSRNLKSELTGKGEFC